MSQLANKHVCYYCDTIVPWGTNVMSMRTRWLNFIVSPSQKMHCAGNICIPFNINQHLVDTDRNVIFAHENVHDVKFYKSILYFYQCYLFM
jgi:hypothetical protein